MKLSNEHHDLLRRCASDGLRAGAESLAETPAASTVVALESVSTAPISALTEESISAPLAGDVVAGVCQRFDGALSGTALFALDPADALLWLQLGDDEGEPIPRFVDLASRLLDGVVRALARAAQGEIELAPGGLEERPVLAALLATHAPADTIAICLDGELGFRVMADGPDLHAPFSVHVLIEPKPLGALLSRLADGTSQLADGG